MKPQDEVWVQMDIIAILSYSKSPRATPTWQKVRSNSLSTAHGGSSDNASSHERVPQKYGSKLLLAPHLRR